MKKILLSLAVITAFSTISMASVLDNVNFETNIGVAFDNVKVKGDSGLYNKTGAEIGFGAEKASSFDNLTYTGALNVGFYDHYETYALDLGGKYKVMPKVNLLAGISYNLYDVDNMEHYSDGFGVQTGVEYKINNNFSADLKYKYVDLNSGITFSHNVVAGVKYFF